MSDCLNLSELEEVEELLESYTDFPIPYEIT